MTQEEKDTALLNVCKSHEENLGEVQRLIGLGANINAVTSYGRTPIMLATGYGHINIVRFLLENGANVNAKDTFKGWTVLMFSTILTNEEFEIAKLLIENGADVNETTTESGETVLIIACKRCHFNIVRLLIETPNIDLDITDNNDYTALYYARRYCGPMIVDLFPNQDSESESEDENEDEFEKVYIPKSDIPEEAWNSIAYGDENIEEFLTENSKNKIFKFDTAYYAVGGEEIKEHYLTGIEKEKNTFYPCFSVGTSIRPRDENVDKTRPLFLLSNIGPITNFVLMKEFITAINSPHKYFEIIKEDAQDILSSTSAQMLGPNPDAVGANHCQAGKAAKIFKLSVLNIVEEPKEEPKEESKEEPKGGRKRKTRRKTRRNTRRKTKGKIRKTKGKTRKTKGKTRK
jgi:hypothetical protein